VTFEQDFTVTEVQDFVDTKIMARRRYSNMHLTLFGSHPELYMDKAIPPDSEEALKWLSENRCYIGTICDTDGDCWGSGAQTCREIKYDVAVRERSMDYYLMDWSKESYRTCTQDYSCSIKTVKYPMGISYDGKPFINIQGEQTIIEEYPFIKTTTLFTLVIKTQIEIKQNEVKAVCFHHDAITYCHLGTEISQYFQIEEGNPCTLHMNKLICMKNKVPRQMKLNEGSPSLEDIKALQENVIGIEARLNFNNHIRSISSKPTRGMIMS